MFVMRRMTGMYDTATTRMPKMPTVTVKLGGGRAPASAPGHQPTPLKSSMRPNPTYSSAKTVRNTRRNVEIVRACHMAPARTAPVAATPSVPGTPAACPTPKARSANAPVTSARMRSLSCSAIKHWTPCEPGKARGTPARSGVQALEQFTQEVNRGDRTRRGLAIARERARLGPTPFLWHSAGGSDMMPGKGANVANQAGATSLNLKVRELGVDRVGLTCAGMPGPGSSGPATM